MNATFRPSREPHHELAARFEDFCDLNRYGFRQREGFKPQSARVVIHRDLVERAAGMPESRLEPGVQVPTTKLTMALRRLQEEWEGHLEAEGLHELARRVNVKFGLEEVEGLRHRVAAVEFEPVEK